MITVILPFLDAVSRKLKEPSTDTSVHRVGYVNDAIRHILTLYKWSWSRKKKTLTVVAGKKEYNLTEEISDYSPIRGIFAVYVDDKEIEAIPYDDRDKASSLSFYLKPDVATIGFTFDIDGDENIDIWYYPEWTNVPDHTSTMPISIPESMTELIALYTKYLIHEGKRQRYDARNALLDFKEVLNSLIPQQGSSKIGDYPRLIPKFSLFTRFKRNYKI